MANGSPRRNGVRKLRSGAVNLERAGLSDAEAREVQEQIEHSLGMRCYGCGRRIQIGMRFTSLDPRAERPVITLSACSRRGCDAMERARDGATCMEMIEFAWLDANGADAPPSVQVQRRGAVSAAPAPPPAG